MPEREVGGDARLYVRGRCSACGSKAQRRMHGENWFHVGRYDDFGVQQIGVCPESGGVFVQEEVFGPNRKLARMEPHYREVEREVWDYDHVNEETGEPEPILRMYMQPVLCTCTNTSCPGWGQPMPESVRKLREQEDALTLERKRGG